ncbi:MAG TPA: PhoPQ-activated protein PqaA family protein [Pirellulales bacterium]
MKRRLRTFFSFALLLLIIRGVKAAEPAVAEPPKQKPATKAEATPAAPKESDRSGPLHAYVSAPDDSYKWVVRQEGKIGGAEWAELTLTSQTWKGTTWRHQLFVIRPSKIRDGAQGILLINGGAWDDKLAQPPEEGKKGKLNTEAALLAQVAERVQSPVAMLSQVPQQPIFDGLVEDAAISYTFDKFLKTKDATWPLLLPMVKSAVRAMDAVQEFSKQQWKLDVKNFTLTGASKRGWTTWLAASVDPRVNAFAPMVIDMLNMSVQMKHQLESFGTFSEQIGDYTDRDLQARNNSEEGRALQAIIDPFAYRKLLTQPKVILLGTNDRYWPLDALNLYWNELEGEKHILYIPNNGHGLTDVARISGTIAALHRQASGQGKLPKLSWNLKEKEKQLCLRVTSDTPPKEVQAWTAAAATRDFRDSTWVSHKATLVDGEYCYDVDVPETGYAAMFGEAIFEGDPLPFFLSTNVKIIRGKDAPKAEAVKEPAKETAR